MSTIRTPRLSASAVSMTAGADPRPWALYGRISKRRSGDGAGAYVKIETQLDDSAYYVQTDVNPEADFVRFSDNLSAWDPEVFREDWETMLAGVASGQFAGVVAWVPDRFTRQPEQMEALFKACKRGNAQLHTTQTGLIGDSKVLIRIQAAMAAEYSDQMSVKIGRRHQTLAEEGKFPGGRRRYGFEPGMRGIREEEAAVIRELAGRIIGGESLASLARDLTERGIPTAEGGKWTGSNLGLMLKRPHLAKQRTHRGVTSPATWDAPAILDDTTYANLVHVLSNPDRRVNKGSNAAKYLLSGIAVCDECGAVLRGSKRTRRGDVAYVCSTGRHCHRTIEYVDRVVTDQIVERLSRVDASGALVPDEGQSELDALMMEQTALSVKLDDLTERNLTGGISDAQLERSSRAVEKRQKQIAERISELRATVAVPKATLRGMTGPDPEVMFRDVPIGRQRAIVRLLCSRVALVGAGENRKRPFRPEDVRIRFRKDDE